MTRHDLLKARHDLQLSKAGLAYRLGVSRQLISAWEAGVSPIPEAIELALFWLGGTAKEWAEATHKAAPLTEALATMSG